VEVDPLAYFEGENAFSVYFQKFSTMGFFQSVDIKATGKLAFKGDKEVAFKSESSVVYSSGKEKVDGNGIEWSKGLVRFVVISSILVAIAGEILASQKLKTEHKILWWSHAGLSRILSWIFSIIQREKIKIELAETVREAKAGDDAAAKARADTERDNAINLALNPVMAALNLAAAVAAAQADAAAAAAAGAQAKANEIDALTRTIAERNDDVDKYIWNLDQRLLKTNYKFNKKMLDMTEKHQKDTRDTREFATQAAAAAVAELKKL
jgi:hypothetical protein